MRNDKCICNPNLLTRTSYDTNTTKLSFNPHPFFVYSLSLLFFCVISFVQANYSSKLYKSFVPLLVSFVELTLARNRSHSAYACDRRWLIDEPIAIWWWCTSCAYRYTAIWFQIYNNNTTTMLLYTIYIADIDIIYRSHIRLCYTQYGGR